MGLGNGLIFVNKLPKLCSPELILLQLATLGLEFGTIFCLRQLTCKEQGDGSMFAETQLKYIGCFLDLFNVHVVV